MTKLVLLSDSYWPLKGGIEEAVRLHAAFLSSRYDVSIVVHNYRSVSPGLYHQYAHGEKKRTYVDPSGKLVVSLGSSSFDSLKLLPLQLWNLPFAKRIGAAWLYDRLFLFYRLVFEKRLRKLIKQADIVHSYSTGYLARCAQLVCSDLGISIVQTPAIHFGRWGDSPEQMKAYSSSDALVCVTQSFRGEYLSRIRGKVPRTEVIPPVMQDPESAHLSKALVEGRFVLFLGRREIHKGFVELIAAFSLLQSTEKLVVAGPGPSLSGSPQNVIDLGFVDEKQKKWLLEHCECLCVPSRDETFGIVYAEAMSFAKPVVALDLPPMNEIIENNVSGMLLSSSEPKELCRALSAMLGNSGLRRAMGKAAKERFERFYSPNRTVSAIERLYGELLEERLGR